MTAEQLMRSRFTAHVVGDADHLFRTWHFDQRAGRWVYVGEVVD